MEGIISNLFIPFTYFIFIMEAKKTINWILMFSFYLSLIIIPLSAKYRFFGDSEGGMIGILVTLGLISLILLIRKDQDKISRV